MNPARSLTCHNHPRKDGHLGWFLRHKLFIVMRPSFTLWTLRTQENNGVRQCPEQHLNWSADSFCAIIILSVVLACWLRLCTFPLLQWVRRKRRKAFAGSWPGWPDPSVQVQSAKLRWLWTNPQSTSQPHACLPQLQSFRKAQTSLRTSFNPWIEGPSQLTPPRSKKMKSFCHWNISRWDHRPCMMMSHRPELFSQKPKSQSGGFCVMEF